VKADQRAGGPAGEDRQGIEEREGNGPDRWRREAGGLQFCPQPGGQGQGPGRRRSAEEEPSDSTTDDLRRGVFRITRAEIFPRSS
jgi:hypothetical protein